MKSIEFLATNSVIAASSFPFNLTNLIIINETQSLRLYNCNKYIHIKSVLNNIENNNLKEFEYKDYNSKINTISKEDLKTY